ncbi:hypothetical protein BB559_004197 [Furculomyces boomerangus]|uniref:Uncharacterized protein n=2 Tax=Harpellales TaxID=61421 RepID=A0A2T9YG15_9FUNG|nr:hypothetical protein BB559_004197 [Furculomyces boomerangus]PVZ99999.1 hypothetical protein BB558_003968 [Smittium angustum]
MSQQSFSGITIERVVKIANLVKQLKEKGETEEKNPELAKMVHFLKICSQHQQQLRETLINQKNDSIKKNSPEPQPPGTTPTQSVPSAQLHTGPNVNSQMLTQAEKEKHAVILKQQIMSFRALSKNEPLPPQLRKLLWLSSMSEEEKKILDNDSNHLGNDSNSVGANAVKAVAKAASQIESTNPLYNILYPEQILISKQKDPAISGRLQRLLVPSITPSGLSVGELVEEREKKKQAYIQFRINILEKQLSLDTTEEDRIKRMIELKALGLAEKQKRLRNDIINGLKQTMHIPNSVERSFLKRAKKQSLREVREHEKLERMQRVELEKSKRQQHTDQLAAIVNHGRDMVMWQRSQAQRMSKLGKAVQQFHAHIEREEQKRQERISKERLQALRADDEEAYLKLIDQTKETRITHLLKQTNQYLDTLTKAVKTQQRSVEYIESSAEKPLWAQSNAEMDYGEEEEEDKMDYYNISHRISEKIVEQPKMLVGGTLKDYQIRGLEWMVSLYNNRLNGILADEMGLGKTIQTISLIAYLIEKKQQPGPFLIIVPLSTITNWIQEFEKWAPDVVTICHKGSPIQRKEMINHIKRGAFNVALTTYDYIIRDRLILSKAKWVHMIVDEGHRMKNVNSKLALTLTQYYNTRYRLILTGTPLQNNLPELWALLNFILPHIFNSVKGFDEWFNAPFAGTNGQDRIDLNEEEQLLIIRRLHKVLRPFLLRRLKKDVESDLPDKVEHIIRCRMSSLQSRLYTQMRKHGTLFLDVPLEQADGFDIESGTSSTKKKPLKGISGLNNTIMQLRKICNHPFVYEPVEAAINPTRTNNPLLYRAAGKFELLDRILPKLIDTGHKILIFFQMTQVMTIMEDFLSWRGIKSLRLDGSTADETRREHMNSFNKSDEVKVFLLSTRAGGQGLNLQTADTVIIFDSDWNPHQDLQAQDRAHRIGQKNEVKILRLITRRSVEETILQRAQYKLDIDGKVIQAGKFDNKSTAEERETFLRSLLRGDEDEDEVSGTAATIDPELREEDDDCSDENINLILSRSDEERVIFEAMDKKRYERDEYEFEFLGLSGTNMHSRLMVEGDLPPHYLVEYNPEEERRKRMEAEVNDKSRRHAVVHYDDGLTEEQWLDALENDNVDLDDYIREKRERRLRRAARNKEKVASIDNSQDDSTLNLTQSLKKRSRSKKILGNSGTNSYAETPNEGLSDNSDDDQLLEPDVDDDTVYKPSGRKRARVIGAFDDDNGSVTVPGTPNTPTPNHSQSQNLLSQLGSISSQSIKKRRKPVPMKTSDPLTPQERAEMVEIMENAYKVVLKVSFEEEGYTRQVCELFLDLPNKREYPDYYIVIKKPISMKMIKRRMKSSVTYNPPTANALSSTNPNALAQYSYSSLEEFHDDWIKMFNNARLYNEEGSMVYEDAGMLQKELEEFLTEKAGRSFIKWKGSQSETTAGMPEEWVSAAQVLNTALSARDMEASSFGNKVQMGNVQPNGNNGYTDSVSGSRYSETSIKLNVQAHSINQYQNNGFNQNIPGNYKMNGNVPPY